MRDVFISYSSADRIFVEGFCDRLRRAGVTFWLDRNEIMPGDYLRQKINSGLDAVDYLVAILSETSVQSEWVMREIDAIMIRELAEKKISLIPLLIGDIRNDQVPADLRGKNYLDFRGDAEATAAEFDRLLNLLKPEVRRRKELILELRQGLPTTSEPVHKLREFALQYRDQEIQKAAVTGLAKIGTSGAIVAITERLFDSWGMNTLSHCVKKLAQLGSRGGYIALSSALFWDERYTPVIFDLLIQAHSGCTELIEYLQGHSIEGEIPLICIYAGLADHGPPDISAAVRYSAQYWFVNQRSPFFLPRLPLAVVSEARSILDKRLPGLADMIAHSLEFCGFTTEEDASFSGPAIFNLDHTLFARTKTRLKKG
jgi:hypothetical protein